MNKTVVQNNRVDWIDSLKGFTIIAVIIGHCLDGYLKADMFPSCYNVFHNIWYFIYSYHMPLFFIISGMTLHLAYIKSDDELKKDKYKSQILNLFLLYVIWALILWGFKMIFSGYVNEQYGLKDLLNMFIAPLGNYWYLYVLCVLYILVYIFKLNKVNKYILVLCGFVLSVFAHYLFNKGLIHFTIYRILFNLFFLCVGMAICSKPKIIENQYLPVISAIISIGLLVAYFAFDYDVMGEVFVKSVLALTMSLVFIWLFKNIELLNNKFLSICGKYCIYIYLIHFYITAGNRKILPMLGITTPFLSLIINIVSALLISLLVASLLSKLPISDILFRPHKFIQRIFNNKNRSEK